MRGFASQAHYDPLERATYETLKLPAYTVSKVRRQSFHLSERYTVVDRDNATAPGCFGLNLLSVIVWSF